MNAFVLTVCGNNHAIRANLCIRSLRKFSKAKIIAITAKTWVDINADQVIKPNIPEGMTDNTKISRYLKTGVYKILGNPNGTYCYIDNDLFAVSPRADEIFELKNGPITFASDPGKTVKKFSKYATKGSLRHAIRMKFGILVPDDWPIWNGGLFLFDAFSRSFLHTWHDYTMQIFNDPKWHIRDQGTLIATVWKHKLPYQKTIPKEFNWLHGLTGGLRHTKNGFKTKNENDIIFIHFPISYGDETSGSWNKLIEIINA